MSNKIVERKYYAVKVSLASPLCISGGENEYSDSDVLRNGNGEVFVPGASFAGAFRNYLELQKTETSKLMGFSEGEDGAMSPLFISDMYLYAEKNDKITVSLRDFVALDEDKNKFDTEIVETGAKGWMFFHYVKREKDWLDFDAELAMVLQGIQHGEIRFGSKKNRGYGRMKIERIFEKTFTKENAQEWVDFSEKDIIGYGRGKTCKRWKWNLQKENGKLEDAYVKLLVPLKLTGGISVRKYSTRPNEADYEQLTCNSAPVIPGSSWTGVVRKAAKEIMQELVEEAIADAYIRTWFGKVSKKESWQSDVVISESIITGGTDLTITRNKINRFDATTKSGALYTEKSHFGGETTLEIMVKKKDGYESILGLLALVAEEIGRGQVPVGGQVAVGRGIFKMTGAKLMHYSIGSKEEYQKALFQKVQELKATCREGR